MVEEEAGVDDPVEVTVVEEVDIEVAEVLEEGGSEEEAGVMGEVDGELLGLQMELASSQILLDIIQRGVRSLLLKMMDGSHVKEGFESCCGERNRYDTQTYVWEACRAPHRNE